MIINIRGYSGSMKTPDRESKTWLLLLRFSIYFF